MDIPSTLSELHNFLILEEINFSDEMNLPIGIIIRDRERESVCCVGQPASLTSRSIFINVQTAYLVKVRRESNSRGVDDVDPEGAGGCKAENLFKLEALDLKASIAIKE